MHDDLLPTAPGVDPIVAEALRNWNACASAHAYKREQSDLDHAFFLGDQWAGDLAAVRDALVAQKMPALVFNDLQQYVFNVVNEQLQNPSEIKISPERGAYAKATATVLQDLIRQIRTKHQGNIAVQAAFLDMVIGGCGYFGLGTEYVSDRSFNQRITFEAIEWDSAFLDPAAAYPTYHDANFGFRFSKLTREEFAEQYPDAKPVDALGPEIEENGWAGADYVRVAQYYYAKRVKKTLLKLQSGAEKYSDEMDPLMDYPVLGEDGQPISRELQVREIWVCKLTASEILESPRKWITKYIPIIPVMGIRGRHNGKEHIFGVLRAVRDPQVASNFMQNLQLLNIALGTKSPWLVAEGQTEDYSTMWGLANVKNYSALKYRRYDDDGRDLGTPIRNNLEPPVQGTQVAINELQQGKQRSMGIYDPSLGKEGPEESAAAILARQKQGQYGNIRWTNGLNIALKFAGEQLLAMIPVVYDASQVLRLEGLDGKPYSAQVFSSQTQDSASLQIEQGVNGIFDLSHGEYSVACGIGPSRDTQRAEAQQFFQAFAASAPEMVPRFADLWARNMDFPGADELADRLIPQDIAAKSGDPKAMLAQSQMQMQQKDAMIMHLSQMVQQLTQEKQAKITEIQGRAAIDQGKIMSQERIKKAEIAKDVLIEHMKHATGAAESVLQHQVNKIESQLDREHEVHMAIFDAAHQPAFSPTGGGDPQQQSPQTPQQ